MTSGRWWMHHALCRTPHSRSRSTTSAAKMPSARTRSVGPATRSRCPRRGCGRCRRPGWGSTRCRRGRRGRRRPARRPSCRGGPSRRCRARPARHRRVVLVAVEVVEAEDRPAVPFSRAASRDLPEPLGPARTTTRSRRARGGAGPPGALVPSSATGVESTSPGSRILRITHPRPGREGPRRWVIRNQSGEPRVSAGRRGACSRCNELAHDAGIPGVTRVEGRLHLVEGVEHAVAVEVTGCERGVVVVDDDAVDLPGPPLKPRSPGAASATLRWSANA